jgi:hypothetical protein
MNKDLLKIGAILLVGVFIIYVIINTFNLKTGLREGLENATPSGTNGEAGSAANYAAGIKAKTVQLQDSLLISKYRADYENVIINMDDYLSISMLKAVLNIDPAADEKTHATSLALINTLSNAKKALNETMAFVDKQ